MARFTLARAASASMKARRFVPSFSSGLPYDLPQSLQILTFPITFWIGPAGLISFDVIAIPGYVFHGSKWFPQRLVDVSYDVILIDRDVFVV